MRITGRRHRDQDNAKLRYNSKFDQTATRAGLSVEMPEYKND